VLGHIATLSPRDIEKIARMGLVITTHTNSNVYKRGYDRHGAGAIRAGEPARLPEPGELGDRLASPLR